MNESREDTSDSIDLPEILDMKIFYEKLDWTGKVVLIEEALKYSCSNFRVEDVLNSSVISGDFESVPKPISETHAYEIYEKAISEKTGKDLDAYRNRFSQVIRMELGPIAGMKFVILDKRHKENNMKWILAS